MNKDKKILLTVLLLSFVAIPSAFYIGAQSSISKRSCNVTAEVIQNMKTELDDLHISLTSVQYNLTQKIESFEDEKALIQDLSNSNDETIDVVEKIRTDFDIRSKGCSI